MKEAWPDPCVVYRYSPPTCVPTYRGLPCSSIISSSPSPTPPRLLLPAGSCTQWEIYDDYVKDLERQRIEDTLKSKGGKKGGAPPASAAASGAPQRAAHSDPKDNPLQSLAMQHALQILDRMANQNMFEEISMDFKYWDDASDAFRYTLVRPPRPPTSAYPPGPARAPC